MHPKNIPVMAGNHAGADLSEQTNRSFRAFRHTIGIEDDPTHPADRLNAVEQEVDQRAPLQTAGMTTRQPSKL